jgi:hypothetical protein
MGSKTSPDMRLQPSQKPIASPMTTDAANAMANARIVS